MDSNGKKGHFVYVGDKEDGVFFYSAITVDEAPLAANRSYGLYKDNRRTKVNVSGTSCQIKELYKFDTRKELYRWLSE